MNNDTANERRTGDVSDVLAVGDFIHAGLLQCIVEWDVGVFTLYS